MNRFLVVALAGLMILAVSTIGSAQSSGGVTIQWGDQPAPAPPPQGGVVQKQGGPPPHAPAHGYRAKHQYLYYPACNVYREPSRGVYFYMKGNGWTVGASLPSSLTVAGLGVSVNLEMDTDKPYEHNAEHVQQYPKEKYKGNKDKDDDDDDHGNGHGKGKGGKK